MTAALRQGRWVKASPRHVASSRLCGLLRSQGLTVGVCGLPRLSTGLETHHLESVVPGAALGTPSAAGLLHSAQCAATLVLGPRLHLTASAAAPHCLSGCTRSHAAHSSGGPPVLKTRSEGRLISTCVKRTNMACNQEPTRCRVAVGITHVITTFPTRGSDTTSTMLYMSEGGNFILRRHIRLESPEGASGVVTLGT